MLLNTCTSTSYHTSFVIMSLTVCLYLLLYNDTFIINTQFIISDFGFLLRQLDYEIPSFVGRDSAVHCAAEGNWIFYCMHHLRSGSNAPTPFS